MPQHHENPFADYGQIISGKYFIGRKKELSKIERRAFGSRRGCLAIIGIPRIGKSSLAYKATIEYIHSLKEKRIIPVWINLGTYNRAIDFLHSLVTESVAAIKKETNWFNEDLQRSFNSYQQACSIDVMSFDAIRHFFEELRSNDIHIVFILDEFDHARNLFKNDVAGIQRLRELAYNPRLRVTYITTSRRSIRQIETQANSISTFDGIFHKLYLSHFEEDISDYFSLLTDAGVSISPSLVEKLQNYTGGHPYLLAMLGYEIVETMHENNTIDIDIIAHQAGISFRPYYDQIVSLMREDGSFIKLLQILFGPVVDVTPDDIDEFLKYGLIRKSSKGIYQAFSTHFQSYLTIIDRNSELEEDSSDNLWSLWKKTEKALRTTIAQTLQHTYGDQWFDLLEKANPRLSVDAQGRNLFERCREAQQKETKVWENRASKDLLDFTYPGELFQLIIKEWNNASSFKSIFGKDKSYWDQRGQFLSRIRTPMAHNRDEVLSTSERKLTVGYCHEILEILQKRNET